MFEERSDQDHALKGHGFSRAANLFRSSLEVDPVPKAVIPHEESPDKRLGSLRIGYRMRSGYRTAVCANFFTMASRSLRSLSFKFDE
jgi:hypothetical protein